MTIVGLQYLLYKKDTDRHVTRVNTRGQQKYVFKTETKVCKKYERSPYYLGTCLWIKLSKDIQDVYVLVGYTKGSHETTFQSSTLRNINRQII